MTNDIVASTGMEKAKLPVVTDGTREDVILCLKSSWPLWDYSTQLMTKHAVSTHVDTTGTKTFSEALAKMTNEQLAMFLYDVWDNGDLKVISTVQQ